ncbi:uncharacterized protein EI97DRAFT_436019 [Westerdykella ornata]|uniref:Uncharacterized protein n=1 Tax=Westerdykella ornata TaxID=318751 RepID=A0A6A6JAI3_WESOR|nr:uncharacterized protein EI97DRAFT_436019 [Westerdykella ornata]KAF2273601.1 hypothetical protein EI97DRAFT_436019 [Westerdykella ornata]
MMGPIRRNNANTLDNFFSTEAAKASRVPHQGLTAHEHDDDQTGIFIEQVSYYFLTLAEPVGRIASMSVTPKASHKST